MRDFYHLFIHFQHFWQQGNDWRPIVTQIALAFGIVIAIDVVTFLFVGDGSGTTAGLVPNLPPLGVITSLTFWN